MPQGLNRPPRENARTYPETCEPYKPYKRDGLDNRLDNFDLQRAPQIRTVPLPKQEDGEDFSCSGSESNLGGGLLATLDGDPAAILLDDILPELHAIEELGFGGFD